MSSRAHKILDMARLKAKCTDNSPKIDNITLHLSDLQYGIGIETEPKPDVGLIVDETHPPNNQENNRILGSPSQHAVTNNVSLNVRPLELETSTVNLSTSNTPGDALQDINNEAEVIMELQPTKHLEAINQGSIQILATGSHETTVPLNCFEAENLLLPQLEENEDENDPDYIRSESEESGNEETEKEESVETKRGKKRQRNPETWKKNVRVQKRAAGEEYISATKKLMRKREMKPPCNGCRMKCTQKIPEDARQLLYSQFWTSAVKTDQKRQFMCSCIQEVPVERQRVRTGKRVGKRQASLKYSFTVNGKKIDVCRTFFLNTLSTSQTSIRFALVKRQTSGIVTADQRGKHEPSNKIGQEARNRIREHIQKFPCIESHYSRNKSKRKYLGSYLNLSQMYRLFHEESLDNKIPKEEIPKEWIYREIFNSEFNLSFKEPENDTCDTCDEYIIKLKGASSQDERNEIQNYYDAHLLDADNRYTLKREDKANCDAHNAKVMMVDLQKCLPTPLLKNAQSFYSLKLWTFNYSIYDATTKSASCYVWDESISGRGGNEMGSCLIKYILGLGSEIQTITIWSDNCPSQNRNIQMIMCYLSMFMLKPSLQCIEHKFLLRGHTHMEVDTTHARVERQLKNTPQFSIITSWDWQQLIRLCGPKFTVNGMEITDFKNFNLLYGHSGSPFQNTKKTKGGQPFLISKVVHLKFLKETPGILHFKTNFAQPIFEQVDFNKPIKRVSTRLTESGDAILELKPLRNERKPIATKKYQDLKKLLKWVPKQFHAYFESLPHANLKDDD